MSHSEQIIETRCGSVVLFGLPNVGKSTLVNALVEADISIMSAKPQTTRTCLMGVAIADNTQILLMDTPGICTPRRTLEKKMVEATWAAYAGGDMRALMIDAQQAIKKPMHLQNSLALIRPYLAENACDMVILNKVDVVKKSVLLPLIQEINDFFLNEDNSVQKNVPPIFLLSALKREGIEALVEAFKEGLPLGPWHFDAETVTNASSVFLAEEITREQIFHQLRKELPYWVFVQTEKFETRKKDIKIYQVIYVPRHSHKVILIGTRGQVLREIGQQAKEKITQLLDIKVHLFLHVKVLDQAGRWERDALHKLVKDLK